MAQFVFISGNQHKAEQLARWVGMPVEHQKVDLDEIQSLNLSEIVAHKAHQAFALVQRPVLVEDVALRIEALGKLPGPFIKWFVGELGNDGICRLAAGLEHQRAVATVLYGLYDGRELHYFEGEVRGVIASAARGKGGFGFDPCFIPEGHARTRAEMDEVEYEATSPRAFAIAKLKAFMAGA